MKMEEAANLIIKSEYKENGFRISFELREDGLLKSDYFPDINEPSILTESEAWILAERFANVNPQKYVNIYVIKASDFTPVNFYKSKAFNRYPPR